jgi:ElaB/YqjD/DUF883 family membrane-anchored ribosome-binding protein
LRRFAVRLANAHTNPKEITMQNDNLRATAAKEVSKIKANGDVGNIREDLQNLKEDAASLLRHSKETGKEQFVQVEEKAKKIYKEAKETGRDYFSEVESYVQKNPGQSLAVAFIGGVLASMLFKHRD